MIDNIIENLKAMEKEMAELRRKKIQAELFLGAVMKRVKEVKISHDDLIPSNSEKVKILNSPDDERYSNGLITVIYDTE